MAIFNFADIGIDLNFISDPALTIQSAAPVSANSSTYSWQTVPNGGGAFYSFNLSSAAGNIVAGPPPSGTISAVSINHFDGTNFAPQFTITGLNLSLANLVDVTTPANTFEKFWNSVLAGASDFILPSTSTNDLSLVGDFINVISNKTGAADNFYGSTFLSSTNNFIVGDANGVASGGKLTGGADLFSKTLASNLFGDVFNAADSVTGGADIFDLSFSFDFSISRSTGSVYGDLYSLFAAAPFDAKFIGGADKITLANVMSVSELIGDALSVIGAASFLGGNDTISLTYKSNAASMGSAAKIVGDGSFSLDINDNSSATVYDSVGGNDAITVTNYNLSIVVGDFENFGSGSATVKGRGGDDTIVIGNTLVSPVPGPPPVVSVSGIAGDALGVSSPVYATFRGGNDVIQLKDVLAGQILGDIIQATGPLGNLIGGDDKITITWDRLATFNGLVVGDSVSSTFHRFAGGDDTIIVQGKGNAEGQYFGDVISFSTGNTGAQFVGGNDVIDIRTHSLSSIVLMGDAQVVAAGGGTSSFVGGNDTLLATNGNDYLYGDTQTAPTGFVSITGGNDILDGRGGNDLIDGGGGIDRAMFNSLAQGVYVDLNGITGSNADNPANPFEAIGQGFDQFVGIEDVTGSILADTLLGDSGSNSFRGGAGKDIINGRGGADKISGGDGIDTLTGGSGADTFYFTSAAGYGDIITDFSSADIISLDGSDVGIASQAALASRFVSVASGHVALNSTHRLIYDRAADELWYDSNGSTSGGTKLKLFDLATNYNFTAADIDIT